MSACPGCGSADVAVIDSFPFTDLRLLWFERAGIDIGTCLNAPYARDIVELTRCNQCLLEFYPAALCGTGALYDHLGKFEYYYQPDKWETRAALDSVRSAPRRVLEIGCGPGRFLAALRERFPSAEAIGIELNPQAVADARAAGLDVRLASLEDLAATHAGAFDLIFAFQVLEHVPTPGAFLRAAATLLAPGGRLVIGVPNADGFTRAAVNDFGNLPPHHLSRWRRSVFQRLAPVLGLRLAATHDEPVAAYHREWYRTVATLAWLSRVSGRRPRTIELGTGHRLLNSVAARMQRLLPGAFWRYRRPGHTILATLEKPA